MKKIFLLFSMALLSLTASAYDYETEAESGDFALGINLDNGTRNPVLNWGLGAKLQFYATHAFRLEGSFNGFINRRHVNFWDVNLNLHYVFYLKEGFSLYPIAGATFMHGHYNDEGFYSNREGCFGLNIGAGLQYDITEHLYVMAEGVYKYSAKRCLDDFDGGHDYYVGPRFNASVGIAYRF